MGYNVLAKPQLCDVACERATLGAALMYNIYLDELTEALFYDGESRAILAVAKAIKEDGKEADIVSVMAYSAAHNSGLNPMTLTELFDSADPVSAFAQNVERLRLLAARRKAQGIAYLLDEAATNERLDIADTLEKAQEQIAEIQQTAQPKTDDYFVDITKDYLEPPFLFYKDSAPYLPQHYSEAARLMSARRMMHGLFSGAIPSKPFTTRPNCYAKSMCWQDCQPTDRTAVLGLFICVLRRPKSGCG